MNQAQLQQMAEERLKDAQTLIDGSRWEFSYDAAGYAVECALKSCILARMIYTAWVFEDKWVAKDCLTHEFGKLVSLAGLTDQLNEAYRIVYAALSEIPECSVLPSEINVITSTDPIARAAVALRDRNPNPIREPKFYRGIRLGNLTSEELCMYPRRFPFEVRELTNGLWQVLINKSDDFWLTCDSEDDARTIAKASVLEDEAWERHTSDEELAAELEKTADAMERYRMSFGSRSLKWRAQEVRQLSKVKGASQVAN